MYFFSGTYRFQRCIINPNPIATERVFLWEVKLYKTVCDKFNRPEVANFERGDVIVVTFHKSNDNNFDNNFGSGKNYIPKNSEVYKKN